MDVGTSPVFTWLIQADSSINPEQHHNHHIVIEQLLLNISLVRWHGFHSYLYRVSRKKSIAFHWIFSKIPTNNSIKSDAFFPETMYK